MSETSSQKGQACAIKLHTRHRQGEDVNEYHFEQMGQLVSVNGNHYIRFDMEDENGQEVPTTIKLSKDKTVTVIRDQPFRSRMRFNPLKATAMRYHSPQGSILLDIHTKRIQMNIKDQPLSADVYIAYDLYSAAHAIGQYDIQLQFTV